MVGEIDLRSSLGTLRTALRKILPNAMLTGWILPVLLGAHAFGAETLLYAFKGGSDGAIPEYPMTMDGAGNLIGSTTYGGGSGDCKYGRKKLSCGTIFKLAPDGTETVLHAFAGYPNDAGYPDSALITDSAGNYYGASGGGSADGGTIYKLAPDNTVTLLYSFSPETPENGVGPLGNLVMDSTGNLYGATTVGGTGQECNDYLYGCGTVFELQPNGTEKVLYVFQGGNDGALPESGLIRDNAGNLYGTTSQGGGTGCSNDGCGTVFKIAPDGTETLLYAFQGYPDGSGPSGSLVSDSAGNLYGTTGGGGASGFGTVFKVTPSGAETVLHSFQGGRDGRMPLGGLIADTAGNLYGTTYFGGTARNNAGSGTAFKLAPDGTETVLFSFTKAKTTGKSPYAAPFMGANGTLYGTTTSGGGNGVGVIFSVSP